MTRMSSQIEAVLAEIRRNDGEGNPEGRTEVHSYHVWEVLNALRSIADGEDEGANLTLHRGGHPSNPPVSSSSVKAGYATLAQTIHQVNKLLPENERFMVPFGVQEALSRYIEERETIEGLMT